jgi:hypothetical protein
MNVTFTTVILNNDNSANLDDLRLSVKVSVICDINHVPILDNGYPVVVQQVKEFKGKRSFGRLCIEDGWIILANLKALNACAIKANEHNESMQVSQAKYLKEIEDNKAKAASIKVGFATESGLFDILSIFEEMGIKKYSFRNPEKLKEVLVKYYDTEAISIRNKYWDKLKAAGFSREQFCNDYSTYLKNHKMVSEGVAEAPTPAVVNFF